LDADVEGGGGIGDEEGIRPEGVLCIADGGGEIDDICDFCGCVEKTGWRGW
jgi:hypothetical protein